MEKKTYKSTNILEFADEVTKWACHLGSDINHQYLEDLPLTKSQCIYVVDWSINKIVYARGHTKLLGYTDDEFTAQLILEYFHPQDKPYVQRIIRGVVAHSLSNNIAKGVPSLSLSCRIRKKDGSYIRILRQSTLFKGDKDGKLVMNFSMLTDIDFLNIDKGVQYDISLPEMDKIAYRTSIFKEFQDFFTPREMEIIKMINHGLKSKDISKSLYVSPHTVTTHRKNILKKSNCHNVKQLLDFCYIHGIL